MQKYSYCSSPASDNSYMMMSQSSITSSKVETSADRKWVLTDTKNDEQWKRMEAIKKFYAELPTDQEIYRQMFKCKNCAEIAIPTPANSIYCTKGHVYCTKCRGHGDLCGWKISGENTTEAGSVCSWRIDCNIVDTFAPRVFQLLSFP